MNAFSGLPSRTIRTADGGSTTSGAVGSTGGGQGYLGARHGLKGSKWTHRSSGSSSVDPQTGLKKSVLPTPSGQETGVVYNRNPTPASSTSRKNTLSRYNLTQGRRSAEYKPPPVKEAPVVERGLKKHDRPQVNALADGTGTRRVVAGGRRF